MKTCPKCGELLGNPVEKCFKCGHIFPASESGQSNKRVCPKCLEVFDARTTNCPNCNVPTSIYEPSKPQENQPVHFSYKWVFVLSLFMPFIGIVLGSILAASDDEHKADNGKAILIFTTVVCIVLITALVWILLANSAPTIPYR